MPDFNGPAQFERDRGGSVQRPFHHIIKKPRSPRCDGHLPRPCKAFGVGAVAELIGGFTRNPHHLRRRLYRSGDRQCHDELPLPLCGPAIMPVARHGNGGEDGGDGFAGMKRASFVSHPKCTTNEILHFKRLFRVGLDARRFKLLPF